MFTEQGQFLSSQNAQLAFSGAIAAAGCALRVEANILVFLRKSRRLRTVDFFSRCEIYGDLGHRLCTLLKFAGVSTLKTLGCSFQS